MLITETSQELQSLQPEPLRLIVHSSALRNLRVFSSNGPTYLTTLPFMGSIGGRVIILEMGALEAANVVREGSIHTYLPTFRQKEGAAVLEPLLTDAGKKDNAPGKRLPGITMVSKSGYEDADGHCAQINRIITRYKGKVQEAEAGKIEDWQLKNAQREMREGMHRVLNSSGSNMGSNATLSFLQSSYGNRGVSKIFVLTDNFDLMKAVHSSGIAEPISSGLFIYAIAEANLHSRAGITGSTSHVIQDYAAKVARLWPDKTPKALTPGETGSLVDAHKSGFFKSMQKLAKELETKKNGSLGKFTARHQEEIATHGNGEMQL